MRAAVTICLVSEACQGPFVFHGDLETGCAQAARFGFDAVEIFARSAEHLDDRLLRRALQEHGLQLAALGTGAGWVVDRLSLTSSEAERRRRAKDYISAMVDVAAGFRAPVIIGSMQGRLEDGVSREQALEWLGGALDSLGTQARAAELPILLEPLNRYETNLLNRLEDTLAFLNMLPARGIKVLCDLFHMNIEERSLAESIRQTKGRIGHVHFADSNRRAVGFGHTDLSQVVPALQEVGYDGFISAEILPLPDPVAAAEQSMRAFRRYFGWPPSTVCSSIT